MVQSFERGDMKFYVYQVSSYQGRWAQDVASGYKKMAKAPEKNPKMCLEKGASVILFGQ